jgi:hypothetical protein
MNKENKNQKLEKAILKTVFLIAVVIIGIVLGNYIGKFKIISQFFQPPPPPSRCIFPKEEDKRKLFKWALDNLANPTNDQLVNILKNPDTSRFIPSIQRTLDNINFKDENQAIQYIKQLVPFKLSLGDDIIASGTLNCKIEAVGTNYCHELITGGSSDEKDVVIVQLRIDGELKVKINNKDKTFKLGIILKELRSESKVGFQAIDGSYDQKNKLYKKFAHIVYDAISKKANFRVGSGEIKIITPSNAITTPLSNTEIKWGVMISCRY